jgi:predicted transcriptional regulator
MIIEDNNSNVNIVFSSTNQNSLIYQFDEENSFSAFKKKIEIKRKLILTSVGLDPGVTYRDLLRKTDLSNGSLSWNIKVLEAQNRLRVSRTSNGNTHLYPISFDEKAFSLLAEIRREKTKEIIFVLLVAKNGYCTMKEISRAIKKAPSTTWWHLKRMYLKGIVFKKMNKNTTLYGLHNRDKIMNLLS